MAPIRNLLTDSHPIIASFAAAAVSLLPAMAMALYELCIEPSGIVGLEPMDDSGIRGIGLVLVTAPLLYIVAVPVCYVFGTLLTSFGVKKFKAFLSWGMFIGLLFGILAGLCLGLNGRFGLFDNVITVAMTALGGVITALPAVLCWWFFVAGPLRKKS